MSFKYWKTQTLVSRDLVVVDAVTSNKVFFLVKGVYSVVFDFKSFGWSCTCVHNSFWGVNSDIVCSHISACKIKLRELIKK